MKNKIIKKLFVCLIFLIITLIFNGCSITPNEIIPYLVSGDFVMEADSEDYSVCGLDLLLVNQSEKDISEFSIVFFLFDKDGEPAGECSNRISFDIERFVDAGGALKKTISLDKYMNNIPEELLFVDYLYVSKIIYADGSVWEDPFGLVALK